MWQIQLWRDKTIIQHLYILKGNQRQMPPDTDRIHITSQVFSGTQHFFWSGGLIRDTGQNLCFSVTCKLCWTAVKSLARRCCGAAGHRADGLVLGECWCPWSGPDTAPKPNSSYVTSQDSGFYRDPWMKPKLGKSSCKGATCKAASRWQHLRYSLLVNAGI